MAVSAATAATAVTAVIAGPAAAEPLLPIGALAPLAGLVKPFGCATAPRAGHVACQGEIRALRTRDGRLAPMVADGPTGYSPAQIRSAYRLTGRNSGGGTVAVVVAYDNPKAEADLAVYRRTFGLPPCTSANRCFRKVNQTGATRPLPKADAGWAQESSLDLDMVSAACPDCRILLVEANSTGHEDMLRAVDAAAAAPGVVAISNSWGAPEDRTVTGLDRHFNRPGIAITAASGDGGYGVNWPAASRFVTAVGGTTLKPAANARGWSETAWKGSGSGCSQYERKPSWQRDLGCARRTVADVAAVADPNTGVAVYNTYRSCGGGALCGVLLGLGLADGGDGWVQVGGTSASAPIVAGIYALAGRTASARGASSLYANLYRRPGAFFDVRGGANGRCGTYLCTGVAGYDGPTGHGTPNGTRGF